MKSFIFLKVSIFENIIILDCLILEIPIKLANITFKHLAKCCFTLWFYNAIKTLSKRKEGNDLFLRKKNCYTTVTKLLHNDACGWKRDTFSSKVETRS